MDYCHKHHRYHSDQEICPDCDNETCEAMDKAGIHTRPILAAYELRDGKNIQLFPYLGRADGLDD